MNLSNKLNAASFLQSLFLNQIGLLDEDQKTLKSWILVFRALTKIIEPDMHALLNPAFEKEIADLLAKSFFCSEQNDVDQFEKNLEECVVLLKQKWPPTRSDEKKWPYLTAIKQVFRLLTHILDFETRQRFETAFRFLDLVNQVRQADRHLTDQKNTDAFFCISEAIQALRYFFGFSLGFNPDLLEAEAEVLAQTENRDQKMIFEELLKPFLRPENLCFSSIEEKLDMFLCDPKLTTCFLTETKAIPSVLSQNDDPFRFLKSLLDLPAQIPSRIAMPTREKIKNQTIQNPKGAPIIFDAKARLVSAPSRIGVEKLEYFDVAIIGAGPGGIAAAANLMANGIFRIVVFERSRANATVADLWSREKEADTFYGGAPASPEGLVAMEDSTRAVFLSRLQSFVDYFHLNIREKEPVYAIRPVLIKDAQPIDPFETEKNWEIETPSGLSCARVVIMVAGRYGQPKRLKWEEGNIAKSLEERIVRGVELDDVKESTVLVIGGGNTAFDNVKTLLGQPVGIKKNCVLLSYPKKPFNVPGSLHAHHNDQLLQWEAEGKIEILWNTDVLDAKWSENTAKIEVLSEKNLGEKTQSSQRSFEVDYLAPAIGWQLDRRLIEQIGVSFKNNRDPDYDRTTQEALQIGLNGEIKKIPGLYLAGDYAEQKSVPAVFNSTARAVRAILKEIGLK